MIEIMQHNLVSVLPEIDQEEVARVFSRYDMHAIPVVDADQCRQILGQTLDHPMGEALTCPVFARAGRRMHLSGRGTAICQIDAETFDARRRRLRAGIVDADVTGESHA